MNRLAMIVSTFYKFCSSRSIGITIGAPARLCVDETLVRHALASRGGVEALVTLLHPGDQLMAQPLKEYLDRHLQEVAQ
jgi:hypothetical protein